MMWCVIRSVTETKSSVSARAEGFAGERHLVMPGDVALAAGRAAIASDLLPTAAGYFPHAAGHFIRRKAGVEEYIVIFCGDGEGWCRFGGRHWRLKGGEAVLIPRGVAHAYGAARQRPWSIFWVHFRGTRAMDYLRLAELSSREPAMAVDGVGDIALAFEDLLERFQRGYSPAGVVALSAALAGLLALLAEHRLADRPNARDSRARVRASVAFMREHLARPMSLADFSRAAGLSVPHYCALFRKVHGSPPQAFFLRMKIQEACQALATTDEPVQSIAARLGFGDAFYFSRLFRKIQGRPPRDYRTLHRTDSA